MPLTLKNFNKSWWEPWANTLIYLPLNWDATNLGTYWTSGDWILPSSTYYSWEYINWSSGDKYFYSYSSLSGLGNQAQIQGSYSSTALGSSNRTVSIWMKIIDGINSNQNYPMYIGRASWWTQWEWFWLWIMDGSQSKLWIIRYYGDPYTNSWTYDNKWHNYTITYSNTNKAKMYVDGSQVIMTSDANVSFNTIWTNYFIGTWKWNWKKLWLSKFIIEDKEWTATETSDYVNKTKYLYWIQTLNNRLNNSLSNTLNQTLTQTVTPNSWSWDILTIE